MSAIDKDLLDIISATALGFAQASREPQRVHAVQQRAEELDDFDDLDEEDDDEVADVSMTPMKQICDRMDIIRARIHTDKQLISKGRLFEDEKASVRERIADHQEELALLKARL